MSRTSSSAQLALCVALSLPLVGCGDGETKEKPLEPKEAHGVIAKETKALVGIIAAYRPHLQPPKRRKYEPRPRADALKAQFFVANEIRHAANYARQKLDRSRSEPGKKLIAPFLAVAKGCSDLKGREGLTKCDGLVGALDTALATAAKEAASAGVGDVPRVNAAAIDDAAKKAVAPYVQAMGGGKEEQAYVKLLSDPSVKPDALNAACQKASQGAEMAAASVEKSGEKVHEVAVIHKLLLDGECNQLRTTTALHAGVIECGKKKKKDDVECRRICAQAKTRIDDGIPAAVFDKLPEDWKESCGDDK